MMDLNPDIFSQPIQKNAGQPGQPHEYRAKHVPEMKTEVGTIGTNYEPVPIVPEMKNEIGTQKTASILAVPIVPDVPAKLNKVDAQAIFEFFTERAGIMEYDGGLDREIAERQALVAVIEKVFAKEPRRLSWIN